MANLLVLQYRVCCVAFTTSGNIFGKTELIKTKHKKGKRPFWCYGQLPFFFLHLSFHSVVLSLLLTFFHSLFSSIFPLTFLSFLFFLSFMLTFFFLYVSSLCLFSLLFFSSLSFFLSFFFLPIVFLNFIAYVESFWDHYRKLFCTNFVSELPISFSCLISDISPSYDVTCICKQVIARFKHILITYIFCSGCIFYCPLFCIFCNWRFRQQPIFKRNKDFGSASVWKWNVYIKYNLRMHEKVCKNYEKIWESMRKILHM